MSTRPAWHSGFFAWFILLWPRHDHFSSQINFKGAVFWTINPLVVTQLNRWKIYMGHILLDLLQSTVLSVKLWPRLKFWHWSCCSWTLISNYIGLLLVTCQIDGWFRGPTFYWFDYNQHFCDKYYDPDWNFGTGLFDVGHQFQTILTYSWWHEKFMDNLVGPLFTNLATINTCMTNIVTMTEILALVSLLFSTNCIRYWPIFGDVITENKLLIELFENRS